MERRGYTPQSAEQKTERTKALTVTLEQQVAAVTDSAAFRAYLDLQSRLYRFSWNNTPLIRCNDLSRFVNKGAHGLDIFAPVFPAGTKNEETSSTPPINAIPANVVDAAQTNGKPPLACDVLALQYGLDQGVFVKAPQ